MPLEMLSKADKCETLILPLMRVTRRYPDVTGTVHTVHIGTVAHQKRTRNLLRKRGGSGTVTAGLMQSSATSSPTGPHVDWHCVDHKTVHVPSAGLTFLKIHPWKQTQVGVSLYSLVPMWKKQPIAV